MGRPHPALLALVTDQALPAVDDLQQMVLSAWEHRMGGLLWSRVAAQELTVPDDLLMKLQEEDVRTWARHEVLWSTLEQAVALLAEVGIECAVFKGVAVEHRWYRRRGDRPCWDLDLVLAPHDVHRFGDALEALQPGHPLAPHATRLVGRHYLRAIPLRHQGIPIDLHADPIKLGPPLRHPEAIWDHTEELVTPQGMTARTLDREASLFQTLVHVGRDRFRYLLGLSDVVRIVGSDEVDWAAVEELALGEGILDPIAVAAGAVADELGLPPYPLAGGGWRGRLWQRLWRPHIRLQGDLGMVRYVRRAQWLLPLTARDRFGEAARWFLRSLFPPSELVDAKHHRRKGPYLWRLLSGRLAVMTTRRLAALRSQRAARRRPTDE
ncbi:MAG: nucleotidyltransferase family protein [Acidimicrobiia bacterium]